MANEDGLSVKDFMPTVNPDSDFSAQAGEPLAPNVKTADPSGVIEALRTVYDPEIPVNIYDLGLVYKNQIKEDGNIEIEMTLTAPGCPVAGEMPQWVADAVASIEGAGLVNVRLVWEPPWNQNMMTEDAKLELGMF